MKSTDESVAAYAIVAHTQGRGETNEKYVDLAFSTNEVWELIEKDLRGPCPGNFYTVWRRKPGGKRQAATIFRHWRKPETEEQWGFM